jgi:hypothetical protein
LSRDGVPVTGTIHPAHPPPLNVSLGFRAFLFAFIRSAAALNSLFSGFKGGGQLLFLFFQDDLSALLEISGLALGSLGDLSCFCAGLLYCFPGLCSDFFGALHGCVTQLDAFLFNHGAGFLTGLWRHQQRHCGSYQATDDEAAQKGPEIAVSI